MKSVNLQNTVSQYIKISCLSTTIRNWENNLFKLHWKYIEEFNQGGQRPVHWKLWHEEVEDLKKGKYVFCAPGLEELIFLNCPYYPKWCTGSVQSIWKSQWHLSQKWNNPKIYLESQKTTYSQRNLKNNKARGITLYYKAMPIKWHGIGIKTCT